MTEVVYCILALALSYMTFCIGVQKGAVAGYRKGVYDLYEQVKKELKLLEEKNGKKSEEPKV